MKMNMMITHMCSKEHTEDDEYKISALCLECQKELFKDEEQDEH